MRHHATRGIARDDTLIANQTGYDLFDQDRTQTLLGSIISCRIGPAAAAELAAWTRTQGAARSLVGSRASSVRIQLSTRLKDDANKLMSLKLKRLQFVYIVELD
jgi:hypothetical protein